MQLIRITSKPLSKKIKEVEPVEQVQMNIYQSNTYRKDLWYYATFKVRKLELLFYKINTCLQKPTTFIGLQTV